MTKPLTSLISISFFLFIISGINAQEIKKTHKDTLNSIVTEYYSLNFKVFQSNSKVSDIDNIFNLFTSDFTYVHPKYGGTYSREDLYNGYLRNQKNGRYDSSVTDIKIHNKITGLNAVVVQRVYYRKTEDEIEKEDPQMTLFEFKDGKISRIFEYW